MKLAFHQITAGPNTSIEEFFRACADAGWRHFEINLGQTEGYVNAHGLDALVRRAEEHGLTCVAATGFSIMTFQGEEKLKACEEQMHRYGEVMQALGCAPMVVGGDVPPEFHPRAQRATEAELARRDAEYRDALKRFAEAVVRIADVAESYGVVLALEVNWCGLCRSIRTMAELVRMVNRPNVGATWDPAHFFSTPSRLADLDLLAGKIAHAHLNDFRNCVMEVMDINGDRVIPGEGVLPLDAWIEKVHRCGYDGWHSVELFSEDLWALPTVEVARRAKEGCLRLWPEATL